MAASPFLGLWTFSRMEDEQYHTVLEKQGLPWAVRRFLQAFTAQREMVIDESGKFLFKSKMLTGSWNELHCDEPTVFSVLGYTIDTLVAWENDGSLLVSTCKTTAADGFVTTGWTATTRITHEVVGDELEITTIAADGQYKMWMTRT